MSKKLVAVDIDMDGNAVENVTLEKTTTPTTYQSGRILIDGRHLVIGSDGRWRIVADMDDLTAHTSRTDNPHGVTKAQVGLGNVDNTSDANKPVSTATQNALDAKADDVALTLKADDANVVHKSGNEEIAGVKTFTTGVYQKSTQDIEGAGYNHRIVNRLYDVNNVVMFDDTITKETNKGTGRKTSLANKDANGDVFNFTRVEFVYQDGEYREYLLAPNGLWVLYRALNADGTGYTSTPMRSSPTTTDVVNTKYVLDRVDELVVHIEETTVKNTGDTMTGALLIDTNQQYPIRILTDARYPFRIQEKTTGKVLFSVYKPTDGDDAFIQLTGVNGSHRWDLTDERILYRGNHHLSADPPADDNTEAIPSCRWVRARLADKQDKLTFDSAPVAGSNNPVTSGGIYDALQSITYEIATEEEAVGGTNNTALMTPLRVEQAFDEKFKVIDGVLNVLENGEWVQYEPK